MGIVARQGQVSRLARGALAAWLALAAVGCGSPEDEVTVTVLDPVATVNPGGTLKGSCTLSLVAHGEARRVRIEEAWVSARTAAGLTRFTAHLLIERSFVYDLTPEKEVRTRLDFDASVGDLAASSPEYLLEGRARGWLEEEPFTFGGDTVIRIVDE